MPSPTKTTKEPTVHLEARNPTMMEAGRRSLPFIKKVFAKAGKKLTTTEKDYDIMSPTSKSLSQPTSRRRPQKRKLPHLPKEDFNIIVRPSQGLPIRELTAPQIAEAIANAYQGTMSGNQFLLRLKPGSKIFTISTPNQNVSVITRTITSLPLNGRLHAVNAYAAVGDGRRKGVIHGLTPNISPETLLENLRIRTQGVEIPRSRMLGKTKKAVITFLGTITTRFVYCMGGEVHCFPFKNIIQYRYDCNRTGHRTDGVPTPTIAVCPNCGMMEPQPDHSCNHVCSTCGEGHLTGTKKCKQRFKHPVRQQHLEVPDRKTEKRVTNGALLSPPKPKWYASEYTEHNEEWPQVGNQADPAEKKRHKARSRRKGRHIMN
ncbi:hypothetical protein HPB51_027047 [Rhipicephalus microplus]|uniref:Uncharacterized protein n=1 Tax=Rhipicephalus microplus TaxID=6941 RepID=A0A9J6D1D5_RHIMP|nr:hypothetical protein HPB51_027047 [Rhipicephalus microplus]